MARYELLAAVALIGAGAASVAGPAQAQGAISDAARLKLMMECDAIAQESIRLSCYDGAVRRGRSAMGADRPGMLPGKSAAQPRTPQQEFGMTRQLEKQMNVTPDRPPEVEEISAKVATATDRGAGLWRIALLDGARWQFAEGQPDFFPPSRGEEVRIRKGVMGSYLMYVGRQPSIRVVRVP
jgi:hypothetical protein